MDLSFWSRASVGLLNTDFAMKSLRIKLIHRCTTSDWISQVHSVGWQNYDGVFSNQKLFPMQPNILFINYTFLHSIYSNRLLILSYCFYISSSIIFNIFLSEVRINGVRFYSHQLKFGRRCFCYASEMSDLQWIVLKKFRKDQPIGNKFHFSRLTEMDFNKASILNSQLLIIS